nr:hypothetical protein [Tanacetum cinerariifolium]
MSRDVLTIGSTMRISLLYRGEYSQWVEMFMNYLEEQTDGEAMINSIKNEWKQYATMMRHNKNLMDINIDALYNILKQNQGDVNDAMGSKKKTVVVTSDPLALIAEKTNVSKSKEKVVVSSDSEGSEAADFSKLKKIAALLAKAFNRRKFYSKPTNNNLRTSSTSKSANKKQEFVKTDNKKVEKKDDEKKQDMSRMSRDVLTIGSTMRIPLLYRGEYSQWVEMFMNYLEEQTDGEAMINSIKNGDQPLPRVTRVSITGISTTEQPPLKDKSMWSDQEKRIIKIDREVNDAMGSKKKTVVVTIDPLALIAEKTKVSKCKEKVVVSSDSEGSDADDFSELKKITALLAKAFNRRKFYSKPTNNNLRTSSTSQSANKKQEFVKSDDKQVVKKDDEKKRDVSKVKYQAWMESSSDSDQEINANMVFMAQIEKVLSDFEATSSSADEKISEVSYYLSESEFKTSKYYDNFTNYGLFVNNDDDQEIFHDAIESASENFIENHIDSQKDYDKSDVDHNDSEEKEYLVDKLLIKFNKKIVKCQKRVEKANQQSKDFENQIKDLQDKYDVLKNKTTTFEMNNKEFNEQLKELIKKNND